jgi:hypothetical protein
MPSSVVRNGLGHSSNRADFGVSMWPIGYPRYRALIPCICSTDFIVLFFSILNWPAHFK